MSAICRPLIEGDLAKLRQVHWDFIHRKRRGDTLIFALDINGCNQHLRDRIADEAKTRSLRVWAKRATPQQALCVVDAVIRRYELLCNL